MTMILRRKIGISQSKHFVRVCFSEAPIEVVKEQDKELNKLGADAIIPAMPGHVVQAFTLLKSSPEAQISYNKSSLLLILSWGHHLLHVKPHRYMSYHPSCRSSQ